MFSARGRTSVPDAPFIHEVLDDVEALDDWPAEASQTPAAADQPPFSLLRQTLMASLDSRARCSLQRQAASCCLPSFCRNLQERPLNIRGTDKIFAMSWLDPWSLLCATKCNQLLRYCMRSHTTTRIPQPPLPQGVRRPAELVNQEGRCGVHSVAISPSRTLLATGGEHPNDTLVYRLPDLQPLALCLAHQDWMFAATWLTDQHLATGGRDGKLLLWRLDCSAPSTQPPLAVLTQPQRHTIVDVKSRCRDLVYCGATRSLVHLEPRGLMACWDPGLWRRTAQWQLGDSSSWCCLAMREDLVAAGGTDKVALVDPRQRRPVLSSRPAANLFRHLDSEGVRSLRLNHHLLSCGSACGTLFFLDLRQRQWVSTDPEVAPAAPPACPTLQDEWAAEAGGGGGAALSRLVHLHRPVRADQQQQQQQQQGQQQGQQQQQGGREEPSSELGPLGITLQPPTLDAAQAMPAAAGPQTRPPPHPGVRPGSQPHCGSAPAAAPHPAIATSPPSCHAPSAQLQGARSAPTPRAGDDDGKAGDAGPQGGAGTAGGAAGSDGCCIRPLQAQVSAPAPPPRHCPGLLAGRPPAPSDPDGHWQGRQQQLGSESNGQPAGVHMSASAPGPGAAGLVRGAGGRHRVCGATVPGGAHSMEGVPALPAATSRGGRKRPAGRCAPPPDNGWGGGSSGGSYSAVEAEQQGGQCWGGGRAAGATPPIWPPPLANPQDRGRRQVREAGGGGAVPHGPLCTGPVQAPRPARCRPRVALQPDLEWRQRQQEGVDARRCLALISTGPSLAALEALARGMQQQGQLGQPVAAGGRQLPGSDPGCTAAGGGGAATHTPPPHKTWGGESAGVDSAQQPGPPPSAPGLEGAGCSPGCPPASHGSAASAQDGQPSPSAPGSCQGQGSQASTQQGCGAGGGSARPACRGADLQQPGSGAAGQGGGPGGAPPPALQMTGAGGQQAGREGQGSGSPCQADCPPTAAAGAQLEEEATPLPLHLARPLPASHLPPRSPLEAQPSPASPYSSPQCGTAPRPLFQPPPDWGLHTGGPQSSGQWSGPAPGGARRRPSPAPLPSPSQHCVARLRWGGQEPAAGLSTDDSAALPSPDSQDQQGGEAQRGPGQGPAHEGVTPPPNLSSAPPALPMPRRHLHAESGAAEGEGPEGDEGAGLQGQGAAHIGRIPAQGEGSRAWLGGEQAAMVPSFRPGGGVVGEAGRWGQAPGPAAWSVPPPSGGVVRRWRPAPMSPQRALMLHTSPGPWETVLGPALGEAEPPAVYCHEWDEAGLRLAVGGGPLHFGLRGCYAALWQ